VSPDRVTCRGVVKTHLSATGAVEALHALDADFPAGVLSVLVGPSGSGKSTLLRLLAGLDGITAGEITVGDTALSTLGGRALRSFRRSEVTYVAQRPADNLVPHLTLREHAADAEDLAPLLELGLGERLDAHVVQLSGGEQARAALGVGLLRRTPVLLVDEPTAELDHDTAAHVLEALKHRARSGATVIVATHDPDAIATADHRVNLDRGGPPPAARRTAVATTPGGPAALEVRDLVKSYGDTHAVDHVSFALHPGEIGALLGRSGSGKSTLLMLLGGWIAPDSGSLTVLGEPPGAVPPWERVGYLPQRFGLLPELSVRDNVVLPLRLAGRLEEQGRADELLEKLGLAGLGRRYPGETSIGQQQRVALARAVVTEPAVLLVDEPTSHQDGDYAGRVREVLLDACEAGSACLVATHDPAAVLGDRIWEIADGRIAEHG
jgi:putative ABC transport system ATP-binding protein